MIFSKQSRFDSLQKKKVKALSVFQKTREKLLGLITELSQEKEQAEARLKSEQESIDFLAKEQKSVQGTVDKLTSLLE